MDLTHLVDTSINTQSNEYLTISETIALLKITRATFWKLQKAEMFKPIYIGKSVRYKKSDIITFLNNGGQRL
ncbi:MAG: DNA-binding protein [Bacteroidia bacterium]|nr:DNA-binding protein [Bacteroidia bacterium]